MFGPLPDQSPVDPDPLETEGLIERDGWPVEIIDEQGDAAALARKVAADLTQQRTPEAAAAEARVGPHAHELHRFRRDGGELAFCDDCLVGQADQRSLFFDQLTNAFAISRRVPLQRIDPDLLGMHRSAGGYEQIEIARGAVSDFIQIGKVEPSPDRVNRLAHAN